MTAGLVAGFASAALVVSVGWIVLPPRRHLRGRVAPYLHLVRLRPQFRSGVGSGDLGFDSSKLVPAGPDSTGSIWHRLTTSLDLGDPDELVRRLRHSGQIQPDPDTYRMQQLGLSVLGVLVGVIVAASMVEGSARILVVFASAVTGGSLRRLRLTRAIEERRRIMRVQVPTLAQLIAVHLRTGRGPIDAVRQVTDRGRGPVVSELADALRAVAAGDPPAEAYRHLADLTAEPAAARLHHLLASSARTGNDIVSSLLALSIDIRAEQRDALARHCVRRRASMIVPLLLLVAPVMVLFVAAAIPSLVLGGR